MLDVNKVTGVKKNKASRTLHDEGCRNLFDVLTIIFKFEMVRSVEDFVCPSQHLWRHF